MALDLIAQAALMAVVALGAWTAMGEGMALRWLAWVAALFPPWITKPLATCPRCMCSVWGIAALIVCGYGIGVDFNILGAQVTINDVGDFVPRPAVAIDWPRLAQIPALILAAIGIQELLHRP